MKRKAMTALLLGIMITSLVGCNGRSAKVQDANVMTGQDVVTDSEAEVHVVENTDDAQTQTGTNTAGTSTHRTGTTNTASNNTSNGTSGTSDQNTDDGNHGTTKVRVTAGEMNQTGNNNTSTNGGTNTANNGNTNNQTAVQGSTANQNTAQTGTGTQNAQGSAQTGTTITDIGTQTGGNTGTQTGNAGTATKTDTDDEKVTVTINDNTFQVIRPASSTEIKTDDFTLTVPAEWSGKYCYSIYYDDDNHYRVSIYDYNELTDGDELDGFMASYTITDPHADDGKYTPFVKVADLSKNGTDYEVYKYHPSDVRVDGDELENYMNMYEIRDDVKFALTTKVEPVDEVEASDTEPAETRVTDVVPETDTDDAAIADTEVTDTDDGSDEEDIQPAEVTDEEAQDADDADELQTDAISGAGTDKVEAADVDDTEDAADAETETLKDDDEIDAVTNAAPSGNAAEETSGTAQTADGIEKNEAETSTIQSVISHIQDAIGVK